jgi:hypothetical protein
VELYGDWRMMTEEDLEGGGHDLTEANKDK